MKIVLTFAVLLIAGPLSAVPDDLEDSFQKLKQAESTKDVALVKKLAAETCALARKAASEPAPANAEEKEVFTKRIQYARDVELHTEYALFSAAIQGPPANIVDLLSTLEQQNPRSKYLDEAYGTYLFALTKTGAASKVPAVAERAIAYFPDNEDLLLVLADNAMNRKQNDHALSHAERLIAVLSKHPAPRGASAADWERKKNSALGRGYWIAGLMHQEKGNYYDADRDLRAALPLITGNPAMAEPALFYLGVANYQLGIAMRSKAKVLEGAKFSEAAGAIQGPLATQAWRNAHIMKTEAAKLR